MTDLKNGPEPKNQKSPDAFRTISEVSAELDVPQHVLRFWETKFPVVKPLKRGGGRRYYRPADVELIRGIRDLLYTHGFTIKGAQKLLKEQGGKIENIEVLRGSFTKDKGDTLAPIPEAQATPSAPAAEASSPKVDPSGLTADHRADLERVVEELKEIRKMLPR